MMKASCVSWCRSTRGEATMRKPEDFVREHKAEAPMVRTPA